MKENEKAKEENSFLEVDSHGIYYLSLTPGVRRVT